MAAKLAIRYICALAQMRKERSTKMDIKEILKRCDHTLLTQGATREDFFALIDDAIKYGTASVCIAPSMVRAAADYADGKVKICTVIGFPNGYSTTAAKIFEARCAVADGADEIDMVINIGMLKEKRYDDILSEINGIKGIIGDRVLKVIIETCLLTEEEKIKMCDIVSESNADFIKTSTGFSIAGATPEDIALFAAHIKNGKKIKAAGGISSIEDAERFIELGAERLGTSRIVKIVRAEDNISGY